jgi:transposase
MLMTTNRDFQLTEQQTQELKIAFGKSADGATRTRLQAVRLYGNGLAVAEIQEITDCSRRSLLRWCQKYRDQGVGGLMDQRQGGNRALLSDAQLQDVHDKLHGYRPVDVLGAEQVATASGQHWTIPDTWRWRCNSGMASSTVVTVPTVRFSTAAASVINGRPRSSVHVRRHKWPNSRNS